MYIVKKEIQRPAFNYLELNQIDYLDMIMIHLIYSFVKMFYFGSILCSIIHNDTMES